MWIWLVLLTLAHTALLWPVFLQMEHVIFTPFLEIFPYFFGLILALSSLLARSAWHFSWFWRLYLWICSFRPHSHIGYWLDEMIVSLEKCFLHIPVLYMLIRILIQVTISTNSMRARNTSQHPQPTVTMLLLQVNNKWVFPITNLKTIHPIPLNITVLWILLVSF